MKEEIILCFFSNTEDNKIIATEHLGPYDLNDMNDQIKLDSILRKHEPLQSVSLRILRPLSDVV